MFAGAIVGSVLWLGALIVVSWLLAYGWATGLGLLVTVVSFVVSLIALGTLHAGRKRQERRYVDGG